MRNSYAGLTGTQPIYERRLLPGGSEKSETKEKRKALSPACPVNRERKAQRTLKRSNKRPRASTLAQVTGTLLPLFCSLHRSFCSLFDNFSFCDILPPFKNRKIRQRGRPTGFPWHTIGSVSTFPASFLCPVVRTRYCFIASTSPPRSPLASLHSTYKWRPIKGKAKPLGAGRKTWRPHKHKHSDKRHTRHRNETNKGREEGRN